MGMSYHLPSYLNIKIKLEIHFLAYSNNILCTVLQNKMVPFCHFRSCLEIVDLYYIINTGPRRLSLITQRGGRTI